MKKKTNNIRARLTVYGITEMKKKELAFFRKWIAMLAKELKEEDPKIFAKNYRATLYK